MEITESRLQISRRKKRSASTSTDDTAKRRKFRSGDVHPAQLLQDALASMDDMESMIVTAHTNEPCAPKDKTWRLDMRAQGFGYTVNSLQRAYSRLLHETLTEEWSSDVAANVRNLADAIKWQLKCSCPEEAEEGIDRMKKMLEYRQVEFKWERIIEILDSALEVARTKKAQYYRQARASEEELREIRKTAD